MIDTLKSFNVTLSSPMDVTGESGNSKTCLDHIYFDSTIHFNYIFPSSLTDHNFAHIIYEKNTLQASKQSMHRNYNNLFKNDNLVQHQFNLMQEIGTIDWDFIRLEGRCEEFPKTIQRVSDFYAPLRAIRSKCKVWIENKNKREISKRDKLFKIYYAHPSNELKKSVFFKQKNATNYSFKRKRKNTFREISILSII